MKWRVKISNVDDLLALWKLVNLWWSKLSWSCLLLLFLRLSKQFQCWPMKFDRFWDDGNIVDLVRWMKKRWRTLGWRRIELIIIRTMMRSMIWWRLDGWESKFSLGIWRQPKIFKCIGDREVMCFPSKKVYACANHVRCSMRVGEEVSHLVHTQENAVAESAPAKFQKTHAANYQ